MQKGCLCKVVPPGTVTGRTTQSDGWRSWGVRKAEHSALLPKPAAVLLLAPVTFCRDRVLASLHLGHCPTWVELQEGFRQAEHSALLPKLVTFAKLRHDVAGFQQSLQ